jgi:hypothetical protein
LRRIDNRIVQKLKLPNNSNISGGFDPQWRAAGLPLLPIDPANEFVLPAATVKSSLRRKGSELAFILFLKEILALL